MTDFILQPRLEKDTFFLVDWSLSRVLLMNDARFPWLVLVPRRGDIREWHELSAAELARLAEEISRASAVLKDIARAAKMNVGALGNLVPQLHIHVVARNPGDAAWPGPVWGSGEAIPYGVQAREDLLRELVPRLS